MRASFLPSAQELRTGLTVRQDRVGQEERATKVALFSVELLVGYPVVHRRYKIELLLGNTPVPLPHFPVRLAEVSEGGDGFWDLDKRAGVIYPEYRSPDGRTVSYEVGFPDGEIPAMIREIVRLLARDWLTGNDTDSEEVREIVEACKWNRTRLKDSINGR